jgi:hypothetical protein
MNVLTPAAKSLWMLLQSKSAAQEADQPQPDQVPFQMPEPPQGISIDDSTNTMVPKSMSVSVKRPLGYGRPARQEESLQDIMGQWGDADARAREEMRAGSGKLESQLSDMKEQLLPQDFLGQVRHANLKPLLALTDSMSGNNLAASYQAPESLTDRQKMILQLEDALQKRRGEISKSEADSLKEKLNFYLKDKDDPLKDMHILEKIDYMRRMGALAGSRIGRAEDDRIERDVQKMADKVSNPQDLQNSLGALEKALGFQLNDYDDTTGTVKGKKIQLPGTAVPGVGRVTFYDKDARNLQSKFARIFNVELKDRSGAAVTSPEMARMKEEFAAGRFNTEQELIGAVKAYKAAATQELKNREAAFRGQVKERYRSRGGQLSDDFAGQPERKSWGGKNYELQGDQWVEVK